MSDPGDPLSTALVSLLIPFALERKLRPAPSASLIASDSMGLGSTWLVGDAFLSNVYSVYDLANNRVGFAALR
jgi:hypothetical protein